MRRWALVVVAAALFAAGVVALEESASAEHDNPRPGHRWEAGTVLASESRSVSSSWTSVEPIPAPSYSLPSGWNIAGILARSTFVVHSNSWRCVGGYYYVGADQFVATTVPCEFEGSDVGAGGTRTTPCWSEGGCGHGAPNAEYDGSWSWYQHQETREITRYGCRMPGGAVQYRAARWPSHECGLWVPEPTTTTEPEPTTTASTQPGDPPPSTLPVDVTTTTLPPTTTTTQRRPLH